jgi:hypothetical protein
MGHYNSDSFREKKKLVPSHPCSAIILQTVCAVVDLLVPASPCRTHIHVHQHFLPNVQCLQGVVRESVLEVQIRPVAARDVNRNERPRRVEGLKQVCRSLLL